MDDSDCTMESLIRDNREVLEKCRLYGTECVLIDGFYPEDIEF